MFINIFSILLRSPVFVQGFPVQARDNSTNGHCAFQVVLPETAGQSKGWLVARCAPKNSEYSKLDLNHCFKNENGDLHLGPGAPSPLSAQSLAIHHPGNSSTPSLTGGFHKYCPESWIIMGNNNHYGYLAASCSDNAGAKPRAQPQPLPRQQEWGTVVWHKDGNEIDS
ncbi:hypothetical protein QBC35DRAFT_447545 [Podospora australis]|uniref:Cyanovirin-N domain-containing protein n=1 Tax=Podospora australis TaxID=1536484 RepID=A0AAN7AMK1_9PEZI|nr:hypothetical protein QBC35DRAFT_447545 [Podospora australis]